MEPAAVGYGNGGVGCIERERQALLRVKEELIDNYDHLSSWGSEDDKRNCCKWRGITYSPLRDTNLGGAISSMLGNLSKLQFLDLSFNYSLDIGNVEWLFGLPSLSYIDLSFNHLNSPNDWLQMPNKLLHLESLQIGFCFSAHDEIPMTLSPINSSSSLTAMDLSYNNLLDLAQNNFSIQLPDLIQNLSGCTQKSLQYLYLDKNQITSSLPNLTAFSSLRGLYLTENRLNGTVDRSIGRLSKLEFLYLGWNSLNGAITEDHFSNLSNLKDLVLSGNSFIWDVSLNWVPPFRLRSINLQSCKMGPHFPQWLPSQKNYSRLDISDAGISDSIPKWFWDLSSGIYHLNLSHNNLTGPVPDFSLLFVFFPFVDLGFNRLDGPLPLPLFPSKLTSSKNSLASYSSNSETIIGPLVYLDLSSNLFSGVIPDGFMHFVWPNPKLHRVTLEAGNTTSRKQCVVRRVTFDFKELH
ncbi:serine-threonine protein kinase, plant-type, putative [Ricinus communis]|uniref:Serine-threonine protein kinase, plant-type, putative n=1 Tax=Ricinus communis TaxID=3988 RepID=B9SJG4_RICCO|nr:serine-threonine protein kinase, plant-type, putative [Ricinus communis]